MSLGTAILTKGTSYVFLASFLVWFAVAEIRSRRGQALKIAGVAMVLAALINAAHYGRNWALFGSILGPPGEGNLTFANDAHSPPVLLSNVTRNLALHAGLPSADGINRAAGRVVDGLHALLGLRVDDPRTTWGGESTYRVAYTRHEDLAGNPLHLVVIALSFGSLMLMPQVRTPSLGSYAVCVIAGFLLFCFVLKWQPWHSRLQLPLFLVAMPVSAIVFERLWRSHVSWLVLTVLVAWSWPYVLGNQLRPLVGSNSVLTMDRSRQYFANVPALELTYRKVVDYSYGNCRQVGLMIGGDQWEYPLWALSRSTPSPLAFAHVNVFENASRRLERGPTPCAIIAEPSQSVSVGGKPYALALNAGSLGVFVPGLTR
jgi:hypothetical protein